MIKKIIESVKDIVKETTFEFTPDGLILNAMDSSHVALIYMSLSECFKQFECENTEVISFNIEIFSKFLKSCDNDCTITCENIDSQLHMTAKGSRTIQFYQNLLDIEADTLMIPEFDYPCNIKLSTGEFQKICKDLKEFGDDVTISVSPSQITFCTNSLGERIEITHTNDSCLINTDAHLQISYSLKYLLLFCKGCPLTENVNLSIGMEQPLRVKFVINNTDFLCFYLAPKIE